MLIMRICRDDVIVVHMLCAWEAVEGAMASATAPYAEQLGKLILKNAVRLRMSTVSAGRTCQNTGMLIEPR